MKSMSACVRTVSLAVSETQSYVVDTDNRQITSIAEHNQHNLFLVAQTQQSSFIINKSIDGIQERQFCSWARLRRRKKWNAPASVMHWWRRPRGRRSLRTRPHTIMKPLVMSFIRNIMVITRKVFIIVGRRWRTQTFFVCGVYMCTDPFAISATFSAITPHSASECPHLGHIFGSIINPWWIIIPILPWSTAIMTGPRLLWCHHGFGFGWGWEVHSQGF